LPSCSLFLKKKKTFLNETQGVSLWHFRVYTIVTQIGSSSLLEWDFPEEDTVCLSEVLVLCNRLPWMETENTECHTNSFTQISETPFAVSQSSWRRAFLHGTRRARMKLPLHLEKP
jgi:hypothetical protein